MKLALKLASETGFLDRELGVLTDFRFCGLNLAAPLDLNSPAVDAKITYVMLSVTML